MSTGLELDLNIDDEAWLDALRALLVDVKVDRRSGHTEDDARFKAIAAWANLIDDFVIACKRAERRRYRGNGSPEGVVEAPLGSIYQRIDGAAGPRLFVKDDDDGEATGWAEVGGSGVEGITAVPNTGVAVDNSDPANPQILGTLSIYEASDDGGLTENLDAIEVDDNAGLTVTNLGPGSPTRARLGATFAAPATIGTANAAGSAASFARSDHVHNIGTHASRHLPGGADPLTTGTPSDVGSANAEGSAAAFARQDHVHRLTYAIARAARVYYEIDLAAQASNTFADGTEVIDGLSWTIAGSSRAGSPWGLDGSTGLRMVAPASTVNTWTVSAQSAPYLYIPLSSIPNLDVQRPLIVDVHLTTIVSENGNDDFRFGIWGVAASPLSTSTARARMADRGQPTPTVRTFDGTTVSACPDTMNYDCVSLRVEPGGFSQIGVGNWSAGWPTFDHVWGSYSSFSTTTNILHAAARFAMILINTSDASPTAAFTVAHLRFREG